MSQLAEIIELLKSMRVKPAPYNAYPHDYKSGFDAGADAFCEAAIDQIQELQDKQEK